MFLWKGTRDPTTGLWVLPFDPKHAYPEEKSQANATYAKIIKTEIANNAYIIIQEILNPIFPSLFIFS